MAAENVTVSVEVPSPQISADEIRNLENELIVLIDQDDTSNSKKLVSVNIPLSILTVVIAVMSVLKKTPSIQESSVKSPEVSDTEDGNAMTADWVTDRTSEWPETHLSAMYAFCPERLSPVQFKHIDSLFNESALFRKMIEGTRRDREWLAPQYGL